MGTAFANTINTVGMGNVITVKTFKHVLKNVKNVVAMVFVVPWKTVTIAQLIVLANLQTHIVVMALVTAKKHVTLV